jgi:hypothetical protein
MPDEKKPPADEYYRREADRLLSEATGTASDEVRLELVRMAQVYQRLAAKVKALFRG